MKNIENNLFLNRIYLYICIMKNKNVIIILLYLRKVIYFYLENFLLFTFILIFLVKIIFNIYF